MRKWLQALTGGAALAIGGYLAYLDLSYRRLPKRLALPIAGCAQQAQLQRGRQYSAVTYNIGYGSYPPSYSFFMAGGKYSRAYSAEAVRRSLAGVVRTVQGLAPDFAFYQEVDIDSDRARHVNELALLDAGSKAYARVFGQNYDSVYLYYPFTKPIGKARSGLVTQAKSALVQATRYALPVDEDFNKFMDLDRAFTASYTPVDNGRKLVLVNVHLSAFTPNQAVHDAQLAQLFAFIARQYQLGNYVLVGGDYNHRVLKAAPQVFHTDDAPRTWTHVFPADRLPQGFYQPTRGLAEAAIPSARALDRAYQPQSSFVTLIDGFICSPNLTTTSVQVIDTKFAYSDHNPVVLRFSLN